MPFCVLAGFMLIGSDVKLNSPSSLIGQALTEILQHPERARDALRVLLHLVSLSPGLPRGPLPSRTVSQLQVHERRAVACPYPQGTHAGRGDPQVEPAC